MLYWLPRSGKREDEKKMQVQERNQWNLKLNIKEGSMFGYWESNNARGTTDPGYSPVGVAQVITHPDNIKALWNQQFFIASHCDHVQALSNNEFILKHIKQRTDIALLASSLGIQLIVSSTESHQLSIRVIRVYSNLQTCEPKVYPGLAGSNKD